MKKWLKAVSSAMAVVTLATSLVCAGGALTSAAGKLKAPSSVKAKVVVDDDIDYYESYSRIKISWKKSAGAKKYTVYRAKVSGSKTGKFKSIATLKKTSYADWEASPGTYYKYKVAAVNGKQKAVSKATKKIAYLDVPISDVNPNSKYNGLELAWDAVDGAKKYSIYRSTEGGKYKLIKSAAFKKTTNKNNGALESKYICSYNDTAVKKGKLYSYYVVAVNGKIKSKAIKGKTVMVFNDYDIMIQQGNENNPLSDTLTLESMLTTAMPSWSGVAIKIKITTDDESVLDVFQYSDNGVQKVEVTGLKPGYAFIKIKATFEGSDEFGIADSTTTQKLRVKVTSDKVYDLRLKEGKTVTADTLKADRWVRRVLTNVGDGSPLKVESSDKSILKVTTTKNGDVKLTGVSAGEASIVISYNMSDDILDQYENLPDEYKQLALVVQEMLNFKMEISVLVE